MDGCFESESFCILVNKNHVNSSLYFKIIQRAAHINFIYKLYKRYKNKKFNESSQVSKGQVNEISLQYELMSHSHN